MSGCILSTSHFMYIFAPMLEHALIVCITLGDGEANDTI